VAIDTKVSITPLYKARSTVGGGALGFSFAGSCHAAGCKPAARSGAERLVFRLRGHVTLRAASRQHGRETGVALVKVNKADSRGQQVPSSILSIASIATDRNNGHRLVIVVLASCHGQCGWCTCLPASADLLLTLIHVSPFQGSDFGGCLAPGSASLHLGLRMVPALRACISTSVCVAPGARLSMRDRLPAYGGVSRSLRPRPTSPLRQCVIPRGPGCPVVQSMGSCLMSSESSPRRRCQ
jgi:hypothetical protein